MIFLIDLDGTLIDSDYLHYRAWGKVLDETPEFIKYVINSGEYDDFLKDRELRKQKIDEMLKFEHINLMKNAQAFIEFIVQYDINHVVVTNTDRDVVEHFKKKVPILNKLKNWIVREDYHNPKPDPECYKLALQLYGAGDTEIIGFENSNHGIRALQGVTDNIFMIHRTTDYLKVIEHIRIECHEKFGMHPTNLNHMGRKKLKPLRLAFATAGSLVLVLALWNLKRGLQNSLERDTDFL